MKKIQRFHPSPKKHYIRGILISLLLSVVALPLLLFLPGAYFVVAGAIWFVTFLMLTSVTVEKKYITLELEENAVSIQKGVFSTKTTMTPYNKILRINLNRDLFDRIAGVGSVEITTSGDIPEIIVGDIPINYARAIIEHTKAKGITKMV